MKKFVSALSVCALLLPMFAFSARADSQEQSLLAFTASEAYAFLGYEKTAKDIARDAQTFLDYVREQANLVDPDMDVKEMAGWNEMEAMQKALENGTAQLRDGKGKVLAYNASIPTGAVISYAFEGGTKEYTAVLLGDVDCNGQVDAVDARLALRVSARLERVGTFAEKSACDVDGDYDFTASDARYILRMSAKLEPKELFFEKWSNKVVCYLSVLADGYLQVDLNDDYVRKDGVYDPAMFGSDNVESVTSVQYEEVSWEIDVLLTLKSATWDDVDELIFVLMESGKVNDLGLSEKLFE